jgi:ABC-type polysaccharide/polyol phosphate export permease
MDNNTFAYGIDLCAGRLTWGQFAEIVGRARNIRIENANLLKKLSFPRLCLRVVIILMALLNRHHLQAVHAVPADFRDYTTLSDQRAPRLLHR